MAYLDDLVLEAVEEKPRNDWRNFLSALVARRSERADNVNTRPVTRQTEAQGVAEKLRRLYQMVEEGIAELDDVLKERITVLKAERERAKAALERTRQESGTDVALDPEKIAAFDRMMRDVLANRDNPTRKAYLRALLASIEVDADRIRIVGSREVLYAAANGGTGRPGKIVQFSEPKWRARRDSNS